MSFSDVQKVVEQWAPDDQDRLAALLTVLRLRRDPGYMEAMDRKIQDAAPENWMTLNDLKSRLTDG